MGLTVSFSFLFFYPTTDGVGSAAPGRFAERGAGVPAGRPVPAVGAAAQRRRAARLPAHAANLPGRPTPIRLPHWISLHTSFFDGLFFNNFFCVPSADVSGFTRTVMRGLRDRMRHLPQHFSIGQVTFWNLFLEYWTMSGTLNLTELFSI